MGVGLEVNPYPERGAWAGRTVDLAMIDALFAAGQESTLRRFAGRLPSPGLRDEARRRLIRIHTAATRECN
jgi:hypothetical protein